MRRRERGPMTAVRVAWLIAIAWLDPSFANARRAAPPEVDHAPTQPPAQAPAGVTFGAVDASTVRIFAVQNVTSEEARTQRSRRIVAIPNMGHGTGFAVPGDDSLVLTAAHVVEDATYVVVRLPGDGAYFPARVAYRDDTRDVAVLQIDGVIPPIELQPATHTLRTRQPVFAVGYPLDASRRQAQSSRGIVGGLMDDGRVQLDMSVNPGNSGGPIIDDADRVVGMVVARGDVERGVQGLAVAVALATLHDALDQARGRLRDGRVPALPNDAQQAAHVIDTLSRVGLMRVLREASDVTEGTTDVQAIADIRALDVPGLSPDLQVLVAAFLWDAAQMLMFRAGDVTHPNYMVRGATRTLTEELLNQSMALLRSASERDPTVADRSPFVRAAGGVRPAAASYGTLRRPVVHRADEEVLGGGGEPPSRRRRARDTWALVAGVGLGGSGFTGREDGQPYMPGAALRLSAGLFLSPAHIFAFGAELDMVLVLGPSTGDDTIPGGGDDDTPNYPGGGVTAVLRFHPAPGPFFCSAVFRVGGLRLDESYAGRKRLVVLQPGLEAGVQLRRADLALRANIGIPNDPRHSDLYTVLLNVAFRLAGQEARTR